MITKFIIVCVLLQIFADFSFGQQGSKFFRRDYTFFSETNSFYKIHTLPKNWHKAKKMCEMEGAFLYYPDDKSEDDIVMKFWQDSHPFSWIYVGISDLLVKGVFETVDGKSAVDIYSNWRPGEPNDAGGNEDCGLLRRDATLNDYTCHEAYPFICKKRLETLDWNALCDLPYNDYVYDANMGKCYKYHIRPMTWTDAYTACNAEESYLAIVNGPAEADHLAKITAKALTDKAEGRYLTENIHLGFHNKHSDGWKTIRGAVRLEDTGYSVWRNDQPDDDEKEQCGAMLRTGQLLGVACDERNSFICEHDKPNAHNSFDDRLGIIALLNSTAFGASNK